MCLLTFMPQGVDMDYERALTSAKANPDGFGFAIHAGVAIIKDHDMDFDKLWGRWVEMRKSYRGHALFHWRIATHGTTNLDNCHPFDVGDNGKSVLAHNGMLPLTMPIGDNRSDTKLFAEYVLPYVGGVKALDYKEKFDDVARWAGGNKFVILTVEENVDRDWYIVNEDLGHWDNDVWWSNSSYKRMYATNYVNYGYKTSPYLGKPYSSYQGGWDHGRDDLEDDYGWVKQPYSLADTNDEEDMVWDQEDELDYIADELYMDENIFNQIRLFTDYSNMETAKLTCYNCGAQYFVDPLEPVPTHCGDCKTCFVCANANCSCWKEYEYGEKYIVWNEKEGTISYETKI